MGREEGGNTHHYARQSTLNNIILSSFSSQDQLSHPQGGSFFYTINTIKPIFIHYRVFHINEGKVEFRFSQYRGRIRSVFQQQEFTFNFFNSIQDIDR